MAEVIFKTGMALFIGSVLLSLTACVSDGSYDRHSRNDGSGETWQERALKSKGGGGRGNFTSDILAGGL